MSEHREHLDEGTLQACLEGELDREAQAVVEAHVAACSLCSAQLEGWRVLLEELRELSPLHPSREFSSQVLARLPLTDSAAQLGLLARLRNALARRGRKASAHLTPGTIQDLLDGIAGGWAAARARAHLLECRACEREHDRWERLYLSLAALRRFRPSVGFAHDVMRRVEAGAFPIAAPAWTSRILAAVRPLAPAPRRAWTIASAMVAAPAIGFLALAALVVANPLLTLRDLLAFGSWRATDILQGGVSWLWQSATDSATLFRAYEVIQTLASSPGITLAALLGIWATLTAAGWIVYRNVVAPSLIASRHV